MRCPARFIAASALAAASLSTDVRGLKGSRPSLLSALESFLTDEAQATPSEREGLLPSIPLNQVARCRSLRSSCPPGIPSKVRPSRECRVVRRQSVSRGRQSPPQP